MRVLIVITKYGYPSAVSTPEMFPQGPAYVAGALEAAGHEVFGCNMSYAMIKGDPVITLHRALASSISECRPDVICLGGQSADYLFITHALQFCRHLSPDIPVVLGGGIVTADRTYIMSDLKPDFSITGDAEISVVELLDALRTGSGLDKIAGLGYWRDGQAVFNPVRLESKQLPDYALPSYDALGLEDFFRATTHNRSWHVTSYHPRPRVFPVTAGRSCPFRCTFCFHSAGSVYKQRSIPDILTEIQHFHEKYRFNLLVVYDELFSVKDARVREFCDGMRSLALDVKWTVSMRVPDIHEDMLRDMKDAGCAYVGVGLESASDVVLESMRKKITKAQIIKAVEASSRAGLRLQGNFIFGDPAETEETIKETGEFIQTYGPEIILNLGKIKPYPGSAIFDDVVKRGIIEDKGAYYSNPHSNDINMTSIPDEIYTSLVREVGQDRARKMYLAVTAPKIFIITQPAEKFDEFQRTNFVSKVTCPHCRAESDRIMDYPHDAQEVVNGNLEEMRAFVNSMFIFVCQECCKISVFKMTCANAEYRPISLPSGEVPSYEDLLKMV